MVSDVSVQVPALLFVPDTRNLKPKESYIVNLQKKISTFFIDAIVLSNGNWPQFSNGLTFWLLHLNFGRSQICR
jgi:hypothetical protein